MNHSPNDFWHRPRFDLNVHLVVATLTATPTTANPTAFTWRKKSGVTFLMYLKLFEGHEFYW